MKMAAKRPPPDRISLSDRPTVRARDFTVVYLSQETDRWQFFLDQVREKGLEGVWFETNTSKPQPCSIPNSQIKYYRLSFQQYFGEMEIVTDSPGRYLTNNLLGFPYLVLARERIAQWLYERRDFARARRLKVLRMALERTMADTEYRLSAYNLMTELYGPRWKRARSITAPYEYCEFLLASLQESGELEKAGQGYRLTPKALVTLENYEEEDRRHEDNARIQRRIVWLTAAIMIIAAAQAGVSYWSEIKPGP